MHGRLTSHQRPQGIAAFHSHRPVRLHDHRFSIVTPNENLFAWRNYNQTIKNIQALTKLFCIILVQAGKTVLVFQEPNPDFRSRNPFSRVLSFPPSTLFVLFRAFSWQSLFPASRETGLCHAARVAPRPPPLRTFQKRLRSLSRRRGALGDRAPPRSATRCHARGARQSTRLAGRTPPSTNPWSSCRSPCTRSASTSPPRTRTASSSFQFRRAALTSSRFCSLALRVFL